MRKRLVSLLFAGIMACSVIGSGVPTFAAENDSHINLALFTYIEGMDPATDWCGWNLTRCGVGETLVTVNENMEIVGQLADEWEQVDDTTYRFHIRQGVKFSNGTELTSEIVKDSIQRSIDNNSRGGDLKIANIEVDGENVVFTTDGAYSAFVSQLTEPMTVIVMTPQLIQAIMILCQSVQDLMQCLSMYLKRRLSLWQMRTTGMEHRKSRALL